MEQLDAIMQRGMQLQLEQQLHEASTRSGRGGPEGRVTEYGQEGGGAPPFLQLPSCNVVMRRLLSRCAACCGTHGDGAGVSGMLGSL
jgi:hypothetical protein